MSPAATCQAPVSAPVSELSALTLADRRELWNYRLYAETQQTLLGSTSLASAYHSVQSFLDREYTLHDISSKFHLTLYTAAARADSEAATSSSSSSSSLLLVVDIHRTDARPEGQRADPFQYKPIDSLWKDVAGWPTSLVLSFPDLKVIASPPPSSSSYSCFLIPASQDSDSLRLVFAIEAAASPVISSNIPKIIHQSFVKPLTPPIAFSVSSFTTLNPQYTHRFVTSLESARHDLVKFEGEDSDAVKAWDLLNPIAFKIDLWRYVVMYHLGGVYSDIKLTLTRPLQFTLPPQSASVGILVRDIGGGICNAFMALPKHTPLMRRAIDSSTENVLKRMYPSSGDILGITGPTLLHRVYEEKLSPSEKTAYDFIQFSYSGIDFVQWRIAGGGRYDSSQVSLSPPSSFLSWSSWGAKWLIPSLSANHRMPHLVKDRVLVFHNAEYRRTVSRPGLTDHYEEMFLKRQVYTDGNPEISSSSSSSSTLEYWLWLIAVAAILLLFISLLRGRRSITETNTPSKTTGKRRVKKE